jgi:glutaminyl-peptide cyclotransferase
MKPVAFPIILILSLFITAFSCSSNSSKSRKPVSTIAVQPSKNSYVFGEKVLVNVNNQNPLKTAILKASKFYL